MKEPHKNPSKDIGRLKSVHICRLNSIHFLYPYQPASSVIGVYMCMKYCLMGRSDITRICVTNNVTREMGHVAPSSGDIQPLHPWISIPAYTVNPTHYKYYDTHRCMDHYTRLY